MQGDVGGVSCKFPAAEVPSVLWIFVLAVISRSKEISATCLLCFRGPYKGSSLQVVLRQVPGGALLTRAGASVCSSSAASPPETTLSRSSLPGAEEELNSRPWIVHLQPNDIL